MATPPRPQKFRQDRQIVDPATGYPTNEFLRWINSTLDIINYLVDIQEIAGAAQAAADSAQVAAGAAQTAAGDAQAAANTAQGSANNAASATALANSFTSGITISAADAGTDVTVTISAHNRVYATDPQTSVAVNGGSLPGLAYSTRYYFYYDQPSRAGGTVTYVATLNQDDAAQLGSRHSVGTVLTPAAAAPPNAGGGVRPPGGNYNEP